MSRHFLTRQIKHLPQGGGQCDPPLPWVVWATTPPSLQRGAPSSRPWTGVSVVKHALTTDADGQKAATQRILERANPDQPNMALTAWKAGRVRKTDVIAAKNYLHAEEITQLNRIAAMFLDYAEDRASQRHDLRMDDWRQYVDRFVEFNERPLLKDAGTVSHEHMQQIAHERYAVFDAKRRNAEALAADVEDIEALKSVEKLERMDANKPAMPRGKHDAS